ncbi:MAG: RluA family pseudouridine synthase [Candidatus Pacebacteria bacterium]|nr:RluA family pseudouridine synthase [Candidatus Paceibacterota bacterium]
MILLEDQNYIVINKPSGMMVHDDGRGDQNTTVSWILKNYPEIAGVGEKMVLKNGEVIERPGIVHRLDTETSGALVIAKNQEAFLSLKKQFQEHRVEKTYHAFVYGNLKEDSGVIDRPIGKSKRDFRKYSAQRGARGKMREAITNWKVLFGGDKFSLLEVYPKTGRTHQIRVHLKAIHHPVIADKLYAPKGEKMLGFMRLALHARKVSFKGLDGKNIEVLAPYPDDFERALGTCRKMGAVLD